MTILVTGFNRFGDLAFNPTQALVEQMITDPPPTSGEELRCHVLPTEYDTAANQIGALIRDIKRAVQEGELRAPCERLSIVRTGQGFSGRVIWHALC